MFFRFIFFISCYCRNMEQINCEQRGQEDLDLKCEQILPGVEKSDARSSTPIKTSGILGNLNSESEIASSTPQKTSEPLHANLKEQEVNLPNKWVSLQMHMFFHFLKHLFSVLKVGFAFNFRYKTIAEFFDRMNCSLRLLSLRKKSTTFQNICTQVEIMTKR